MTKVVDNSRHTWISAILQKVKGETIQEEAGIEEFLKCADSYSLEGGWKGLSSSGHHGGVESEPESPPLLESIQAIVDEILVHFNVSPWRKFVRLSTTGSRSTATPECLDLVDGIGEEDGALGAHSINAPNFVFASSSRTVLRIEGDAEGLEGEELGEDCSAVNDYMRCVSFLKVQTRGDASEWDSESEFETSTPEPAAQLATYARYVASIN